MKLPLALFVAMLLIVGCNNNKANKGTTNEDTDSCKTALKFSMALELDSGMADDFSGDLNNYWGEDKTKLDFKHVFKSGELVHSYFYYENGAVQEEYTFKCEALHGVQKWYYEDGKLAKTIPYSYGRREGIVQLFDEQGRLRQKVVFKGDSIIGDLETFDESGRLIPNDSASVIDTH